MNVTLKRTLAAVLTLCMLLAVLPTMVFAADEPGTGEQQEGLVLNKTAVLEDDGTYTIKLEAYATGVVTTTIHTTTVTTVKPTDIILILDQSGSMAQNNVSGIPTGEYVQQGTTTNAALAGSDNLYYRAADGKYYKITAKKVLVSKGNGYVDADGNHYTEAETATTWRDQGGTGNSHNASERYAISTLRTYTYTSGRNSNYYQNDLDSSERHTGNNRNAALTALKNDLGSAYTVDNVSVGGFIGIGTRYFAAAYKAVVKEEDVYRYEYSYEDENGETISVGHSAEGDSNTVDRANASVSPLYTMGTTSGTRVEGLQYAAQLFIDNVKANAEANNVDHRIAVIGYASTSSSNVYYANSELFVGATQYNYASGGQRSTYNTAGNLAADHYGDAFQSVTTETGYNNLTASVGALAGEGATWPHLGFEMANGVFDANPAPDRDRIIIFFTDGEPGATGYSSTAATPAVNEANISKNTHGATVYTVALLDNTPTSGGNVDNFLKNTSSSGSYTLAKEVTKLTGFFKEITQNIETPETNTTASVRLTENAYMLDELSEYFEIPEGYQASNISLQIAKNLGNGNFGTPSFVTDPNVVATVEGNSVKVSGFDYISDTNMVRKDEHDNYLGYKLIVTIPGVLAKDEAAQNKLINTNTENAGIWDTADNGEDAMIKAFPMPQTRLDKKFFVLDYAKKTELKLDNLLGIDDAEDDIFSELSGMTSIAGWWGDTLLSDGKLTYTPTSMLWDGWDYFYALNKDNAIGDKVTHNIWNKVSVVPANNVYFEDTFITNDETGVVGIEFSDGWDTMDPGTNQGNADDGNQGWIKDFEGETGYSDGTVAGTSEKGATATFTFIGTGVDIYSRTNMTTGSIAVILYQMNEDTQKLVSKKMLIVDNLAQNGDYYQIPTASFSDLPHGEYTVKLIVNSVKNQDGSTRSMYYLDGIRIYNPLGTDKDVMEEVKEGYGDEIGASFTSIREILLKNETLNENEGSANGVVYIDYNTETDTKGDNTSLLGTYKDLGPKNEVYLATGNAIAFKVPAGLTIQVGMKGPQGVTAATVSNGNDVTMIPVNGAGDQFYSITPKIVGDDALVVIKNSGANLLSITKLKVSGDPETTADTEGFFEVNMMELMDYVRSFNTLREVFRQETVETEIPTIGEIGVEMPIKNPGNPGKPVKPIMPPIGKHVQSSELEEQLFSGVRKLLAR